MALIPIYRNNEIVRYAQVDDDDADEIGQHRWYLMVRVYAPTGYQREYAKRQQGSKRNRQVIFMHRVVAAHMLSAATEVDHRSGDGLDNRRENLRMVTHAQNMQNRAVNRNSSTGIRGVWREGNSWRATATLSGKKHHIGCFTTAEDAAVAVRAFRLEHMPYSVEATA